MRVRSFVPWVLVVTTGLGGAGLGPVFAQDPGWPPPEGAACKPTKKDVDEAKTLFGLGKSAHDTSNYTDAIKYYRDAYKRDCTAHLLLKNLGKVYEADAQYANAVEAYKLYRARGKPTGEELDQIDAKIANLSKKVQTTSEPTGTTTAAPTGTTTTAPTSTDTAPTGTTTATVAPTSTTAPPSGDGGGPGLAPWIVAGVGGAVFIGGGVLWLVSNSTVNRKQNEFDDNLCGVRPRDVRLCQTIASDGNSAKSTRTVGAIAAGVGIVAVGVGVVWALTAGNGANEKKAGKIEITPGPTLAGIGIGGAF